MSGVLARVNGGSKMKKEEKTAGVVASKVVTQITHLCLSDSSRPRIDGIVTGSAEITWPVVNDRFQMSYCPWCGLRLPRRMK